MYCMRMPSVVEILAERVGEAADLIVSLRSRVQSLERDLLASRSRDLFVPVPPPKDHSPSSDTLLVDELQRLRTERAVVRESIRGLIREIDRVSW